MLAIVYLKKTKIEGRCKDLITQVDNLIESITNPDVVIILTKENVVLGFCTLQQRSNNDDTWKVIELFVKKPYRHQGYARSMIDMAYRLSFDPIAKKQGLSVKIYELNLIAIECFKRLGFTYRDSHGSMFEFIRM